MNTYYIFLFLDGIAGFIVGVISKDWKEFLKLIITLIVGLLLGMGLTLSK